MSDVSIIFAKKRNIDTMEKPFVKWVSGKGQLIEFASGELGKESVTEKTSATAHPCFLSAQSPRQTKRTQPRGIRKMQEVSADVSF